MTRTDNFSRAIAKSPILWGSLTSAGFYGLVYSELLAGPFIRRYFASHPVEYVATTMFFVGLAALALKIGDMLGQHATFSEPLLGSISPTPTKQTVGDCQALLERLDRLPGRRQSHYLVCRLREALEHVRRQGSAETLDDQLKYLADLDAGRQHASFALVRVIIWAIPILGFLGTVIGITLAIANLAPEALENSLPEVTAGLGVAFDTTALALGLSIILMFAQFITDRAETALLAQVDERATEELEGRFELIPAGPDGQVVALRQMSETVVAATDRLVQRQAALWRESMEAAGRRWANMAQAAGKQLQTALGAALAENLKIHAQQLTAGQQSLTQQNHQHWQKVQQTQTQGVQALASLQTAMGRQGEVLSRAIEASGEVAKLEDALNRNLATLAGATNFEQTVMSLAAAIHLLNARLAESPGDIRAVKLDVKPQPPQAA